VGSGKRLQAHELRRQVPEEIYEVLLKAEADGWVIREQGHKASMYCPCGDRNGRVSIPGTPRNAGSAARRMERVMKHCPNDHGLDG